MCPLIFGVWINRLRFSRSRSAFIVPGTHMNTRTKCLAEYHGTWIVGMQRLSMILSVFSVEKLEKLAQTFHLSSAVNY